MKVVKPGPLPQPLEPQVAINTVSCQTIQSEANSTVVGRKPQRLRSKSTRHSKPLLAVRSLVGSPDEKTVANLVIRRSRFYTWAGTVPEAVAGAGATAADSTPPARKRVEKEDTTLNHALLERAVKSIQKKESQTRKRRQRSRPNREKDKPRKYNPKQQKD